MLTDRDSVSKIELKPSPPPPGAFFGARWYRARAARAERRGRRPGAAAREPRPVRRLVGYLHQVVSDVGEQRHSIDAESL